MSGKLFLKTALSFESCQETLASFQGTCVHNDSNPSNSGRKLYMDYQQESNWRLSVTLQHSYLHMPVSAHSHYCFHPCRGLAQTQVSPVGLHFLQKPAIPTPDFAPLPGPPPSPAQSRSSLSSLLRWVLSRPERRWRGSLPRQCVSVLYVGESG